MERTVFVPRLSVDLAISHSLMRVFALVLVLHLGAVLFFGLGWKKFTPHPLPEVTIELGASPPPTAVSVTAEGATSSVTPAAARAAKPVAVPTANAPQSSTRTQQPVAAPSTLHAQADAPFSKPEVPAVQAAATVESVSPLNTTGGPGGGSSIAQPGESDSVRTVEADYKAATLNNARPPYPKTAYRLGIEGTVVVLAEVSADGKPLQVRLFKSSGNDLLDDSATRTVTAWKFSPARKNGQIVQSWVKIPITFSLGAPR